MVSRNRLALGLGLVVGTLITWAGTAGAQQNVSDSRHLFTTYCASCHGATGKGDGAVAPHLNPRPANLTLIAKRNNGVFPSEKITMIVDGRERVKPHGNTQMPVWGDAFSRTSEGSDKAGVAAKIQAVVQYLESIQER
jgi:mono/diheme cytochrome c family protein